MKVKITTIQPQQSRYITDADGKKIYKGLINHLTEEPFTLNRIVEIKAFKEEYMKLIREELCKEFGFEYCVFTLIRVKPCTA